MSIVSNTYSAHATGFSTRHARSLHVAPEVADFLHLGSGSLRLDGAPLRTGLSSRSPLRSSNDVGSQNVVASKKAKAPMSKKQDNDRDDSTTRRSSVETQSTLIGSISAGKDDIETQKQNTSSAAPLPSPSSSAASSSSSTSATQPRRMYAAPLQISADVEAILKGRTRGGGALSLGGEPLRATAKGDVTNARQHDHNTSSSSTNTNSTEGQQRKSKLAFLHAWK